MKTEITVKRVFEVGDTFVNERGRALVVRAKIIASLHVYLAFHTEDDLHLTAQYVNERLDFKQWTYLGKVVKEEEV